MKEYKVVKGDDIRALEHEVDIMIRQGWIPLGGVSITSSYAFQAMVLKTNMGKPQ
jgi:hypothetical protein